MLRDISGIRGITISKRMAEAGRVEMADLDSAVSVVSATVTIPQEAKETPDENESDVHQPPQRKTTGYLWASFILMIACVAGFLPAVLVFFDTNMWQISVWYPTFPKGYPHGDFTDAMRAALQALLNAHACFASMWVVLSIYQAWSGSTRGETTEKRRVAHRWIGRLSALVVLPFIITGLCALWMNTEAVENPAAVFNFTVNGIAVVVAWGIAIWAAVTKRFPMHKDIISVAIGLSTSPGTSRAVFYVWQSLSGLDCSIIKHVPAAGSVAFGFSNLFVLVTLGVVWVQQKRTRELHVRICAAAIAVFMSYCFIYGIYLRASHGQPACPPPSEP